MHFESPHFETCNLFCRKIAISCLARFLTYIQLRFINWGDDSKSYCLQSRAAGVRSLIPHTNDYHRDTYGDGAGSVCSRSVVKIMLVGRHVYRL